VFNIKGHAALCILAVYLNWQLSVNHITCQLSWVVVQTSIVSVNFTHKCQLHHILMLNLKLHVKSLCSAFYIGCQRDAARICNNKSTHVPPSKVLFPMGESGPLPQCNIGLLGPHKSASHRFSHFAQLTCAGCAQHITGYVRRVAKGHIYADALCVCNVAPKHKSLLVTTNTACNI